MDSQVGPKKPKLIDTSEEGASSSGRLAVVAVRSESAAPHATVSNEHDLFNKVFSNDVIWEKLAGYLNVADLKDCRRTCQLFNKKIIYLKSFKDSVLLKIHIPKRRATDFENTAVQWRHLAINLDRYAMVEMSAPENQCSALRCLDNKAEYRIQVDLNPFNCSSPDPLSDFLSLLSSATSLKLYRTNFVIFGLRPQYFSTMLPVMPNIQKITIDVRIFAKLSPSWFANASLALISKVKEFHLESHPRIFVPDHIICSSVRLPLASVHLEVLRIALFLGVRDNYHPERAPASVIDRLDTLFRILQKNQNHLKSIQLEDPHLWTAASADRLGALPKFPQLKVLKLDVETDGSDAFFSEAYFNEFLSNQADSLEEIGLTFKWFIPPSVFQIIKHQATNLKVLRITTREFHRDLRDMKKWSFLKESKLQEFSFQLDGGSVGWSNEQLQDFFYALPTHAKKLSITDVHQGFGQRIFNLEVSKCFNPAVLTHLNMRGCTGLLNDSVLQELWKTLKNLRLLDLSYSGNNCTDWGFTGGSIEAAQEGVAISLLKELKSLTLKECVGLTNRTLINGIKFPKLQFLDLFGNLRFTDEGYLAVVHQNPSLQTLVIIDRQAHRGWLSRSARRRRHVKLNSRLTLKLCEDDWGACYSDRFSSDDEESGN